MLKIFGAVMVMLSVTAFALNKLAMIKQRLALIRGMKNAMTYISSYIGFSAMPLEEMISELLKKADSCTVPAFEYFLSGLKQRQPADGLWKNSLAQLPLSKSEIMPFEAFGGCLGMADRSIQLKTIENILREADMCEGRLIQMLDKYRNVEFKLVIMCGITAVILLI